MCAVLFVPTESSRSEPLGETSDSSKIPSETHNNLYNSVSLSMFRCYAHVKTTGTSVANANKVLASPLGPAHPRVVLSN